MSKSSDKQAAPAYVSKKSFTTFVNAIREGAHVPLRIDRTLMPKFSGSAVTETLAALKFLGLTDDKGVPTPLFEKYVMADDEARKPILAEMLQSSYASLFSTPGFDLTRATSQQVAEHFRDSGLSGSTLSRAMMFFLACAAEAGIKVSPNVKAPTVSKTTRPKKEPQAPSSNAQPDGDVKDAGAGVPPPQGHQVFEIAIPINRKVRITIPSEWSPNDWDLFQAMLALYIEGWKAVAVNQSKEASGN